MKKFALVILFVSFYCVTYAQTYAVINDKDGFVNVRKDKTASSLIVGKIYDDSIFSYDDEDLDKSGWVKIHKQDFNKEGVEGYITKSRIFNLSKFKSIKSIRSSKDSCVTINDSLKIIVKSRLFNPKNHSLSYRKPGKYVGDRKELTKIDGKHIWGVDGNLPRKAISAVRILKQGISITIPKEAFDDLYEPSFKTLHVYFGKNDIIYIEMDNSDGAGAYSIFWIIKNGQYIRRYIDNSNV